MEEIRNPKFDTTDRCDACGAQAWVRFQLNSGGHLLFCAHHARLHADAMSAKGVIVDDERQLLAKS